MEACKIVIYGSFFHFQDSNGGDSTYIRFLLVQPKSLQECKIIYEDAQQKAATQIFEEAYSAIKACIFYFKFWCMVEIWISKDIQHLDTL